jgi:hypothetical protein
VLSALSALFDYMCEHNAVSGNEGSTPALGDAQARKLLPPTRSRGCATAPSSPPCSITASDKAVGGIMGKMADKVRPLHRFVRTTGSDHDSPIFPSLATANPGRWSTMPSPGGLERRIGKLVQAPA